MSKSVLGRGLGELLGDKPAQAPSDTRVYVSPGVKTILQAGNGHSTTTTSTAEIRPGTDYWPLIRAMLVVSDLTLLGLSGLIVWRAGGALSFLEAIACSIAVAVGALMACASLLLDRDALTLINRFQLPADTGSLRESLPHTNDPLSNAVAK